MCLYSSRKSKHGKYSSMDNRAPPAPMYHPYLDKMRVSTTTQELTPVKTHLRRMGDMSHSSRNSHYESTKMPSGLSRRKMDLEQQDSLRSVHNKSISSPLATTPSMYGTPKHSQFKNCRKKPGLRPKVS